MVSPIRLFPLETPRLVLRRFTPGDAEVFSAYRSDPEVARYQSWDAPYSLEQAQAFISGMETVHPGTPGSWLQLAMERKQDGQMIGDVGFEVLAEDPLQAEIGFTLARDWQGHGFAIEAVSALLDMLFGKFGMHRVRANCDPLNTASKRLLERVGMRHEGRWVQSLWFKGGWADEDWYAILREEWDKH